MCNGVVLRFSIKITFDMQNKMVNITKNKPSGAIYK